MAVLASLVYQYIHCEENGCVKDRCLDKMAQIIVKKPSKKGKMRSNFFLGSSLALMNKGSGMNMMRRSLVRLNTRFTIYNVVRFWYARTGLKLTR